jgi:hypothetical protein
MPKKHSSKCEATSGRDLTSVHPNVDKAQRFADLFVAGQFAQLNTEFPPTAPIILQDQTGTIPFAGSYVSIPGGLTATEQLLLKFAQVATAIDPPTNPPSSARGETYFTCDYRKVMIVIQNAAKHFYRCVGTAPPGTFLMGGPTYFIYTFDNTGNLIREDIFFNEADLVQFFSSCPPTL